MGIGLGENPSFQTVSSLAGVAMICSGGPVAQHRQHQRLALSRLHIGQQRIHAMERMAIDSCDRIAVLQAGLCRWVPRLHLRHLDRPGIELRRKSFIAKLETVAFGAGRHMQASWILCPARSTVAGTI